VHLVINNQVGFSISNPADARSGRYCTDIAKFIEAPVFHVNGDDVEAALWTVELAHEFRHAFKKDVFIDLVCYRRQGHNESDEPRATQPLMYKQIDKHPGVRALYAKALEQQGVLEAGEAQQLSEAYRDRLDAGESVVDRATDADHVGYDLWKPYMGSTWKAGFDASVPLETLKQLGTQLASLPEGFKPHPRVAAIFKTRAEMASGNAPLDWGMAENLAYATLVTNGHPVRISGQDSGRGTFFHRHARIYDVEHFDGYSQKAWVPLANLAAGQARFEVIDSTLSELAVLGFEYGYASTDPHALVIWEAQYGDFANGAQAVIDQYISAAETKWDRLSGLVMMLPHGYEGQGPEHSSARLERYMQLCAEDNMQVCVPSTPAQLYHMLRRQVLRAYRKPLIYFSPKSMLRHKASVSSLEELANGRFMEVIGDEREARGVDRVVLCSGKLYYDLAEAREKQGASNVAIVRLEQLYPFPEEALRAELARYPQAQVVWCQEEPLNMGAWYSIQDDLLGSLHDGQTLACATRPRSASPAVGSTAKHNAQQQALIGKALALDTARLQPANK
jgi:2-oxoglutarate dehydrogenase E1 component